MDILYTRETEKLFNINTTEEDGSRWKKLSKSENKEKTLITSSAPISKVLPRFVREWQKRD